MKLAIALLILWLAMLAFFFALHPAKPPSSADQAPFKNPAEALNHLMTLFGAATAPATSTASSDNTPPSAAGAESITTEISEGAAS